MLGLLAASHAKLQFDFYVHDIERIILHGVRWEFYGTIC